MGFIRRNPLTVTIIVMIAVFVPSLFGAVLIGLLIGLALLLIGPLMMIWRLRREARRIERDQQTYGQQGFGQDPFSGFGGKGYNNTQRNSSEGEVKIYTTSEKPQKRVSDNVGDYVEFEEVKDKK